jgi:hypothetical protein
MGGGGGGLRDTEQTGGGLVIRGPWVAISKKGDSKRPTFVDFSHFCGRRPVWLVNVFWGVGEVGAVNDTTRPF